MSSRRKSTMQTSALKMRSLIPSQPAVVATMMHRQWLS
jgi:hypothetical protein